MGSLIEEMLEREEAIVSAPKVSLMEQLEEGTYVAPTAQSEVLKTTPPPYTEKDLVKDEWFKDIAIYEEGRRGLDKTRGRTRRQVVESFTNNMRGFAAGNSVRTVAELRYLHNLKEDSPELAAVGRAYEIFEGMSGMFSGEVNYAEVTEIVGDYTRTTLADPINILGGWFGKAVGGGGTRVAAQTAKALAKRAYQKKIAAGAVEKVAVQAGEEAYKKFAHRAGRRQASDKLLRDTGLKAVVSNNGARYIVGATAVDSLAAIGTDIAYQDGLIYAGAQDEYSTLQTGLAALGGLVMGGVQAGRIAIRGTQNIPMPDFMVKFKGPEVKSKDAMTALKETLKKMNAIDEEDWASKVMRGKHLKDFRADFWRKLIMGDDEKGIDGLAQILYQDGYRWSARSEDDKITKFMADVLKSQEDELQPFLEELTNITGRKFTAEEFGDAMVVAAREAGTNLNVQSQVQRLLKEGVDPTVEDVLNAEMKGFAKLRETGGEGIAKWQNNLIRLLVSNPATTLRNIRGWGAYSSLNSVTDIVQSGLHGGAYLMTGSKESLKKTSAYASAQRMKLASILDPDMAYESFMSISRLHGEHFKGLSRTHVGGVVDTTDVASMAGVNPKDNMLTMAFEKYTEFANIVSGVKIQDAMTKSIEFNYQMDKHLRLKFGVGMSDFYAQPDVAKIMWGKGTKEDYAWALSRSIMETEKSIFGKSYRGKGIVGEVATIIEDIRKVPGIGLTMPFGRFFNNTVAFLSDHTGVSLAGKMFVGNDRDVMELSVRGAVGLSVIYAFMQDDVENLRDGVPLKPITHMELPGGRTMDVTSEFPIAPMKAIARSLAYQQVDDKSMSREETEEALKLLTGQISRNMTSAAGNVTEAAMAMLSGEGAETQRKLMDIMNSIPSQVVQSATRWIDPINEAAGLWRGEAATVSDRRQGKGKINNYLRYLDQIVEGIGLGTVTDQKYSATAGRVTRRPSAVLGSKEVEYTQAMKLMDSVGIPYYKLDSYTKDPKADNRWNQIFFSVFDDMAGDLIVTESFLKSNQDGKRRAYDKVRKQARLEVYNQLETSMRVDDGRYAYILKIAKSTSWSDIDKGIKDLGFEESFVDLSLEDLERFKHWLDNKGDLHDIISDTK